MYNGSSAYGRNYGRGLLAQIMRDCETTSEDLKKILLANTYNASPGSIDKSPFNEKSVPFALSYNWPICLIANGSDFVCCGAQVQRGQLTEALVY